MDATNGEFRLVDPWTVPTAVADCIDADDTLRPYLRDFRYVLAETRAVPYDELASNGGLRAGPAALNYVFGREVTVAILAQRLADLPGRESIERQVLEYIAQVYNVTGDTYRQARSQQEKELMTTLAEQWKQEGKAEGEFEGAANTIIAVPEARFGALTEQQRAYVRSLPIGELDARSRRPGTAEAL